MSKNIPYIIESIDVPLTLEQACDPQWLGAALSRLSGGAAVMAVETVEILRTVATKLRFAVRFEGDDKTHAFCLKGFLDVEDAAAAGGATSRLEFDYYRSIAPVVGVRSPTCVAGVFDPTGKQGVFIMRDLIATEGARFCSALEPVSVDQAAQSLEQIARLHSGQSLLNQFPWIQRRIGFLASIPYVTPALLQSMLDGPRGEGLPTRTRDGALLLKGMNALAAFDEGRPQTLVHGDCHAGNLYWTADGPGLIDWQVLQAAGWSIDVAYHINALLTVDVAEREERNLLNHYLETMRGRGAEVPSLEAAWEQYRVSALYGYYMWAITRRVDPAIINVFVNRLGLAATRHQSFRLLGL